VATYFASFPRGLHSRFCGALRHALVHSKPSACASGNAVLSIAALRCPRTSPSSLN
jgi:hypothetical protein